MTSKLGQRLVLYEQGELDEQETIELFEELFHTPARKGGLMFDQELRFDQEELRNELTAEAWDVVMESDYYVQSGQRIDMNWLAMRVEHFVTPTLMDITNLAVTDLDDQR